MIYTLRPPRRPLSTSVGVARPFAAGLMPATYDPRASLPPVENQRGNSCEAHAYVDALWIAGGQHGEQPSHMALYSMARLRERAYATQPLPDAGCNDYDLLGAITLTGDADSDSKVWGLVPGSVWPDADVSLAADLPFDVIQAARPILPEDVTLVVGSGADLIDAIKAHAIARQPVAFTMQVDAAYEQLWGPKAYLGLTGPSLGRHKQSIVGHRPGTSGTGLDDLLVRGSWGDGWADGGYAWIAGSFIAAQALDFVSCIGCSAW